MTQNEILNNLILNKNAYFYNKSESIPISKTQIQKVFQDASKNKTGKYLLKIIKNSYLYGSVNISYSICIFKFNIKPAFINTDMPSWDETKLAYLLIVEIDNFIIISCKNISSIKNFIIHLTQIDYKILSTLFINDNTLFEKFGLKNMNLSEKAIRQKNLEAINLKDNYSSLGASNYIINSLRVNNENDKVTLSLNSSRINKLGKKNGIEDFLSWTLTIANKIKTHTEHDTFISIFAEPQDYEKVKDTLAPFGILFLFSNIYDDFENKKITGVFIKVDDNLKQIDLFKQLIKFERMCPIKTINDKNGNVKYKIENSTSKDLFIKLNDRAIALKSKKLKKVILRLSEGSEVSIIDYINQNNNFLINFESSDLIYTNRKLFKDSRLLGSIDNFLRIFKTDSLLTTVTSEKGNFCTNQTIFDRDSIFGFVENKFMSELDFLICDDLGNEWADHIGITNNKVKFFHSKYKESYFSASAFQDIVGQALKNLGNMSPQDFQLTQKSVIWKAKININNINTSIDRLRKGSGVDDAINRFSQTIKNPYLKREVYLIVN